MKEFFNRPKTIDKFRRKNVGTSTTTSSKGPPNPDMMNVVTHSYRLATSICIPNPNEIEVILHWFVDWNTNFNTNNSIPDSNTDSTVDITLYRQLDEDYRNNEISRNRKRTVQIDFENDEDSDTNNNSPPSLLIESDCDSSRNTNDLSAWDSASNEIQQILDFSVSSDDFFSPSFENRDDDDGETEVTQPRSNTSFQKRQSSQLNDHNQENSITTTKSLNPITIFDLSWSYSSSSSNSSNDEKNCSLEFFQSTEYWIYDTFYANDSDTSWTSKHQVTGGWATNDEFFV